MSDTELTCILCGQKMLVENARGHWHRDWFR